MRKPLCKDCQDDNGEFDPECYEEAMSDYADCAYDDMRDRQMEEKLERFEELAGMPYSKAVQVIKTKGVNVIKTKVTEDSYPVGDKSLSDVIKDLKNGYVVTPF